MEAIIDEQHDLARRMGRTVENLHKAGASKMTRSSIVTAIRLLDAKWKRFTAQHDQIRTRYADQYKKHEYYSADFFQQAEDIYAEERSELLELQEELQTQQNEERTQVPEPRSTVRATLPKISIPKFSGKYEDWPSFRDLFLSLIGDNAAVKDVSKLHYLKTALEGEAEEMLRNLPTTGPNYARAWDLLTRHYENKRLLVRGHYSALIEFTKMKTESAEELKRFYHCVTNTAEALASIGRPISSSEDLYIILATDRLDPESRREWEHQLRSATEPPTYEMLREFLEFRLTELRAMQPTGNASATSKGKERYSRSARAHLSNKQDQSNRCALCQKGHFIMTCEKFTSKSAAERKAFVDSNHLCSNCLGRHRASDCQSKKSCWVCGERHHSSLHDAVRAGATDSEATKATHVGNQVSEVPTVLLATARVQIRDRSGSGHLVRALVDQGSETSIVTEALAQRLHLPRKRTTLAVFGVGGQQTGVARGEVTLTLTPRNGGTSMAIAAVILPKLTVYTGGTSAAMRDWPHLRDLELADPEFLASGTIDVLLGADVYAAIIGPGVRKRGPLEPVAQQTSLGWIVSGNIGTVTSHAAAHQGVLDDSLSKLVRRFWEQEELTPPPVPLTEEEKACEELYARTHYRNSEGRYVVRLPVKQGVPALVETRRAATRMLRRMEERFRRDASLQVMYKDFMRLYEELGHMTLVENLENPEARTCYLPHHGVFKEASTSTKLRVVFNGSWTTAAGDSLNKHLMVGPNLLPALDDILLRWRCHRYVFAADVEKMYRQIVVHPADRDLQRIVWRDNEMKDWREYQLNTVTYGLACAPYLAIRTLKQLAEDEEARFPRGAAVLRRDVYVDDVLSGTDTSLEAQATIRDLVAMCKAGGFPLRKWAASDFSLLQGLPRGELAQPDPRAWLSEHSHSMLGLQWLPNADVFTFAVRPSEKKPITKRTVLSQTARLFDPLGWISPTTIQAKIIIQSAWLQGLGWDDPLSTTDCAAWRRLWSELPLLGNLRIPRWLRWTAASPPLEIHGFADASERAYAAVVYLRPTGEEGIKVMLIGAKTKVAPLKRVALPRLELCAAHLLVRLTAHFVTAAGLTRTPIHLWSDSTVTLSWIRGHPARWKTYVANRVTEIQATLPGAQWHHVPSKDNPADCASRGLSPKDLIEHELWWHGPAWLRGETWAAEEEIASEGDKELVEERSSVHVSGVRSDPEESSMLARYSGLRRLLRISAWCRRWLRCERRGDELDGPTLSAWELERSLLSWIRVVQETWWREQLETIRKTQPIPGNHPLKKLSPFFDEQGVLRVGGRLKHSLLTFDEKHPIVLPGKSRLIELIIDSCHRDTLHGGVQQTLSRLRQRYWVPCGRRVVKAHIHRCVRCTRWRATVPRPMMADLPGPRVSPARPFLHTGVDYAGPIQLRAYKGRGHKAFKAFIAVFVCMCTRAVHLEVVSEYTTDAFLAALRRFISRRGLCLTLYSDCGTNFVGADRELRALFTASGQEARQIATAATNEGIRWRFNPPAAPHFGGIWEAAVKSLKHHLRRVIGEATLTFEEMTTLLAQVEACLNSRPLQPMTDDPEDTTALTPGHFLIGSAIQALPEPMLADTQVNRLTRWQFLQQMRDHFWDRWSQEYIHTLTSRSKWQRGGPAPAVGQLCLVRGEVNSPARWPLARITAVHPGRDNHIRVVTVRTATSELTRPLVKLVLLPSEIVTKDEVAGMDL